MKSNRRKKRISTLGAFVIMLVISVIIASVVLVLHDVYGFFGNDESVIEQQMDK